MSEPEQDPTPKIQDFIARLLEQGFLHDTLGSADPGTVVRQEITHRLTEQALAGGVAPHQVADALVFSLEDEGDGYFCITAHNMFTMLLVLGVVRDPEILQALTDHAERPETGGWVDRFTDERGGFELQFTPPGQYVGVIYPNKPVEWISAKFNLPPEDSK